MKSKIVQLHTKNEKGKGPEKNYSALIQEFMEAFGAEFEEYDNELMFEFTKTAWNYGNMKMLAPKEQQQQIYDAIAGLGEEADLMKKMLDFKVKNYSDYPNFIEEMQVVEKKGRMVLEVETQLPAIFLNDIVQNYIEEEFEDDEDDDEFDDDLYLEDADFEQNFINRQAINITQLQPYVDWCAKMANDEQQFTPKTNTYLIDEEVNAESWLKKNFDRIFERELNAWYTYYEGWPQKRTYKLFRQWFKVDIAELVFDLEDYPVSKE